MTITISPILSVRVIRLSCPTMMLGTLIVDILDGLAMVAIGVLHTKVISILRWDRGDGKNSNDRFHR